MIKADIFCVRIDVCSLHDGLSELIPPYHCNTRLNAQLGMENRR
jgi:hypothetical protein